MEAMNDAVAAPSLAIWDTETNGLLKEATTMHCVAAFIDGTWYHGGNDPFIFNGRIQDIQLPDDVDGTPGPLLKDVVHFPTKLVIQMIAKAKVRVAHFGNNFDDRVTRKLFPDVPLEGQGIDTVLISKLLYPKIFSQGPNNHKLPGQLRMRHSLEAWGYRLGEKKAKDFDPTGGGKWEAWSTWDWDMSLYMLKDVVVLVRVFKFLMSQKPSAPASAVEHDFATIMDRQELWGFTFDFDKALLLESDLKAKEVELANSLRDHFGEWWAPGPVKFPKATRSMKVPQWPDGTSIPDVTIRRVSPTTGKDLKPYVGPPLCEYVEGCPYTPIEWTTFNPGSRDHVKLKLDQLYGWKPTKFSKKTGAPTIDDDVLRALPYPEAQQLADYYQVVKILGYVSGGAQAWLTTMHKEGTEQKPEYRQHGRVDTIGTYTFRCSHSKPNLGQVPTRSPEYGHRCRELFLPREGFKLVGFDGSGMQLRLMAHHMARFDGGEYAKVFAEGLDPHAFMRDTIGVDLMGEGDEGRAKGKTVNYALLFGGGDEKLGSIISPTASTAEKKRLGRYVKERLNDRFGAFEELKAVLKGLVEDNGYIVGLDGRKAPCGMPHTALSTLLQMGEAIVMRKALVILDQGLQAEGLRCGVLPDGSIRPLNEVDYEFCANVHDEAQADVREVALPTYERLALSCVRDAGLHLNVKCQLKSDVKIGNHWGQTH